MRFSMLMRREQPMKHGLAEAQAIVEELAVTDINDRRTLHMLLDRARAWKRQRD